MLLLTFLCLFGLTCSQVSAYKGTEAIVGGDYAKKGDFKYHVSVHHENGRCGGAIIDDHYILTAAHCVTDDKGQISIRRFLIIAGTHNLRYRHDAAVIPVETIYIPKHFKHNVLLDDIAILKLKHSLQISHHHHKLEKVQLPKPDAHFDDVHGIFTGFGDQEIQVRKNSHGQLEEFGGKSDDKLKFANVKVITNQKCQELNHYPFPSSIICGQALQENKHHFTGACNGDSGGPFVHKGEIIGVLSRSPTGCNESNEAAMYTRVSSYLNFINSVIHGTPGVDVAFANIPH